MNKFDIRIIRSIINGEIPGARKTLFFIFAAIFLWVSGMYYSSSIKRMEQSYEFQKGRLVTLNELAVQYKQLLTERSDSIATAAEDLIPVFSRIVNDVGTRERLIQISTVSRGISVSMERLYAEDLVEILNGLQKHGIRVYLSEIRALPYQDKRLFSFTATLEVEN
jgi:hypothetical protein